MLYYNGFNTYYGIGCEILLSLCILWWFPSLFLLHCRRIVRYVVQLSEEIQAMEGGDLDHPITIRGSDEITTLASCLDSMRVTLRQQQEEEAQASAKVKNLITEMSHDLRTPLTTLLLYTEYVRRILDNITSNLLKYADPDRDVVVRFVQEGSKAGLCFENCVLPVPASSESTKVGLPSIETMMEKMQGVCRIERPEAFPMKKLTPSFFILTTLKKFLPLFLRIILYTSRYWRGSTTAVHNTGGAIQCCERKTASRRSCRRPGRSCWNLKARRCSRAKKTRNSF